jgi:hypothetical protein
MYRQIGRFLALEDTVDISCGTPIYVCAVDAIGNQFNIKSASHASAARAAPGAERGGFGLRSSRVTD